MSNKPSKEQAIADKPARKLPPNAGKGRPKGTPNKVTREFRETVQRLLEDNAENFGRWLTLVAEGDGSENGKADPAKALDIIAKLAEYAAPKLGRTELTGAGGKDLPSSAPVFNVTVKG